jgi:hypothetical protein
MPVAKIAKSLKRTLRATQQKAYSIGVSLNRAGSPVAVGTTHF